MFNPKPIPKFYHTIFNLSFHLLCLIGLSWQITQISINYFRYGVLSDIKIIMPGGIDSKALTICFRADEMYNHSVYRDLIKKSGFNYEFIANEQLLHSEFIFNLTLEDRFRLAINGSSLFSSREGVSFRSLSFEIFPFTISSEICYQLYVIDKQLKSMLSPISPGVQEGYALPVNAMRNITDMYIVLSPVRRLPWSEFSTVDRITEFKSKNATVVFFVSSYSMNTSKLKSPYTDQCVDYASFGYEDRYDAIRQCLNDAEIEEYNELSGAQLFTMNSTNQGMKIASFVHTENRNLWEACLNRYGNDDCTMETMFTVNAMKTTKDSLYKDILLFAVSRSKQASLIITSKARIDDIDFITYILGALGSWIGFSFLNINPIPYFFKAISQANTNQDQNKQNEIEESNTNTFQNESRIPRMRAIDSVSKNALISLQWKLMALEKKCDRNALKIYFLEKKQISIIN